MEMYELRYFLGVARVENIHRASEKMGVSTASLSKAISRLENELGVKLFTRERRNIKLTAQGRLLQKRAADIVQLEESARTALAGGDPGMLQVVLAGPEILLAKMGTSVVSMIKRKYPTAKFELIALTESEALEKVQRGEAHLALVSGEAGRDLKAKVLAEVKFQTYVGRSHPLQAKAKKTIDVKDVLKFAFVSPDLPFLGQVGAKQALDGWRDDQFPRRVDYRTSSLKILEELVVNGEAVAYLPDYYGEALALSPLKISGCPYVCTQKIKLVAHRPENVGWLNQIF